MTDRLESLRRGLNLGSEESTSRSSLVQIASSENDEAAEVKFRETDDKYDSSVDKLNDDVNAFCETVAGLEQALSNAGTDNGGGGHGVRDDEINSALEESQGLRRELKRLVALNEQYATHRPDRKAALRMRVNAHQAVARTFVDAMGRFEKAQDAHRDGLRRALKQNMRDLKPEASDAELEEAVRAELEGGGDGDDAEGGMETLVGDLPAAERKRLQAQVDTVRGRTEDIKRLEGNIVALHEMFVDMQLLVQDQGELLNAAEYNIEETKEATHAGVRELVQTRDYQRAARRKKLCMALLIIVLILVIAVPILIVYIPKWFPGTRDTIESIPIIGGGSGASPSPSAAPGVDDEDAEGGEVEGAEREPVRAMDLVGGKDKVVELAMDGATKRAELWLRERV